MTIEMMEPEVIYPESDGKPMAENTLQFEWIVTIEGGLDALFRPDPDVFVAGDLLWYPMRGDNRTCLAPDAMVVFGRPKGHRGAYVQYLEANIAPQVVFEVLSPGNTRAEMRHKRAWYEEYGVEEYYECDPDRGTLAGWIRHHERLVEISVMEGWGSPRLSVRFGLDGHDLVLVRPDGQRFASYLQLSAQKEQAQMEAAEAQARAALERDRAEETEARALLEKERTAAAEARATLERERAEEAEVRVALERERSMRLAARLKELGLSED